MDSFLNELAEIFEVETSELKEGYELDEYTNWDSLAHISVIVLIDEHFNLSVSNEHLRKCVKLSDLFYLIQNKKEKTKI